MILGVMSREDLRVLIAIKTSKGPGKRENVAAVLPVLPVEAAAAVHDGAVECPQVLDDPEGTPDHLGHQQIRRMGALDVIHRIDVAADDVTIS